LGLVIALHRLLGDVHILYHYLPIKPDKKADTKRYVFYAPYASNAVNKPVISGISRWC